MDIENTWPFWPDIKILSRALRPRLRVCTFRPSSYALKIRMDHNAASQDRGKSNKEKDKMRFSER